MCTLINIWRSSIRMSRCLVMLAALVLMVGSISPAHSQVTDPSKVTEILTGSTMTYTRLNNQRVEIPFNKDGTQTNRNLATGRVSPGTWWVGPKGQVCMDFMPPISDIYCFLILDMSRITWSGTNGVVTPVTIAKTGK